MYVYDMDKNVNGQRWGDAQFENVSSKISLMRL